MANKMMLRIYLWLTGGEEMMALLLAQRVILGKTEYAEIPASLKPQVKEILEESGLGYMAE